jgi:hypothetical protein
MYSCNDTLAGGLPHSDIHGSKPARGSPWLFAACHVLHRLLVPRHPPNALIILRSSGQRSVSAIGRQYPGNPEHQRRHSSRHRPTRISIIYSAQHRIQNLVRSLRRTNKIRINAHNASEPSLSDLGARARPRNPNEASTHQTHSPGQTSTGQRDEHGQAAASIARAQRRTRT